MERQYTMGKKTTLEEGYVHINNGGIIFKIVEVTSEREREKIAPEPPNETAAQRLERYNKPLGIETAVNRTWHMEVRTSHFGSGVTFKFPLGNPSIVQWLIQALQNTLKRMQMDFGQPTDGYEFAFRNWPDGDKRVDVRQYEGRKVDFSWPIQVQTKDQEAEAESSG